MRNGEGERGGEGEGGEWEKTQRQKERQPRAVWGGEEGEAVMGRTLAQGGITWPWPGQLAHWGGGHEARGEKQNGLRETR